MQTIQQRFDCTIEVNRSKFIAYLIPYKESEGVLKKLKEQHPKASHIVYALRYINKFDQIVENSTDNGEPKGCAGVPVLNVLRGNHLVDSAVYIVRYFGGIKLGTGGMARAYASAAKHVIDIASVVRYEEEDTYLFSTSYKDIDKTQYRLKQHNLSIIQRDFGSEDVTWKISGSKEKIQQFIQVNKAYR